MKIAKMKNNATFNRYKNISLEILKELLFTMIKIRRVEEKIVQLYPEQEMRCPVHLCVGQEAIPVGVCKSLNLGDVVFGSHRSHGYYIARGGDLKALFAELYGKITGCTKGKGGSQHLAAPEVGILGSSAIVAGTIPIAVGAALSLTMQKKKSVALVDFGDGVVDEGTFYESLNFAALKKLPVVFVCENNFYATHAHQSVRQARDNIFQKAKVFGVPGIRLNGNDVVEVFITCRNAIKRARLGKGPTLIECRTYRWLEHVGPNYDYNLGYRSRRELNRWMKSCPIKAFEEFLLRKRLVKKLEVTQVLQEIDLEIKEAISFAKESIFPPNEELLKDVYCV